MELRPYQNEAIDGTYAALQSADSALGICATGGGKTTIFSVLANHCTQGWGGFPRNGRVLILVNRKQLLRQTALEVQAVAGIIPALEQADNHAPLHASVVVASVDTLVNRLSKYAPDHFAFMVIDEAHLMVGERAKRVIQYFKCKKLGVTATPNNKGKRALSKFYDSVAFDISLLRLIKEGWLCPITVAMSPLKIDISSVKMSGGDLDTGQLSTSISPYFDAICQEMAKYPHRKWLCFLPVIQSSIEFTERLNSQGFRAAHVDGTMDNTVTLERFKRGELDVLTCSQLLYFGYNEPSIDGIVNLRQTKSINFYEQLIGRGTRKSEDTLKHELLVLDFLWQYQEHGLVRPAFVLAKDEEEADEMQRRISNSDKPVDLLSLQSEVSKDIHEKLKEKLRQNAKKKGKIISIIDILKESQEEECEGIYRHVPSRPPVPISAAQRLVLGKHLIDVDEIQDSEHAHKIINWLNQRIEDGKASIKQVKLLQRLGMPNDWNMSFKQANHYLDKRLHYVRKK